jgi:hypothetical protein
MQQRMCKNNNKEKNSMTTWKVKKTQTNKKEK